jgi:hypothetical protein
MPNNPFTDFPSGLMSDYDFYITMACFIRDPLYNNGQTTQLELMGKAFKDGVLVADDHTERYNCPKDWSSKDEGLTVTHSGNASNFNKNSQIAKFYIALAETAPQLVQEWSQAGASPQQVNHLVGNGFHMTEQTEKFVIDGQNRESTRNYPSAYLGKDPSGSTGQAASGTTNGNGNGEADLIAKLKPLALAHDHEEFVNAAIAIPGVSQYTSLVKRIADPDDLWTELRAGA